jgi:hypothetical protein
MERIQALIEQLNHQQAQNASPSQLLLTVQMLHSELLIQQRRAGSLGTAKVAVTLPSVSFSEEVVRPAYEEIKREEPVKIAEQVQEHITIVEEVQKPVVEEVVAEVPKPQPYTIRKPTLFDEPVTEVVREELKYQPKTAIATEHRAYLPTFETEDEVPTLIQHQSRKEVNDLIAERKESLNDRLKEQKKEVAHVLKETPVKDLRKAIGINDRFLFVSELFRGDDSMYERSIKTINSFHVLSEAEYWINRELKVKLAWNEDKDTVQHFYHLVRRRFA